MQAVAVAWLIVASSVAHADAQNAFGRLVVVQPEISQRLQQKSVVQIVEDKKGFLWFVTQGALHRFDGHEIVALPQPQQDDAAQLLGRSPVSAITSAADGSVWIATVGEGLVRFDTESGQFQRATDLGFPPNSRYQQMLSVVANEDGILGLSQAGLFFWDQQRKQLTDISFGDALHGARGLWNVGGRFFVASHNALWALDERLQLHRIDDVAINGLTTAMTETPSGAVLAFGDYGAAVQWRSGQAFQPFKVNHAAWSARTKSEAAPLVVQALVEPDGRLWLLAAGVGVVEQYAHGTALVHKRDIGDPSGFQDGNIISMCRDRAGRLWFGTLSSGVFYRAEGYQWFSVVREKSTHEQVSNNNVFALLPDSNGGLWIGLENSGLRYLDDKGELHNPTAAIVAQLPAPSNRAIPLHLNVRSIVQDGDSLLIGHSQGLFRYWPQQKRVRTELQPWLGRAVSVKSAVRSIRRRNNGDLLIASDFAGLLIWQKNGEVTQYSNKGEAQFFLPTNRVLDAIEDTNQQIWLATDAGLYRLVDKQRAQHVAEANITNFFNTLHLAGPDELWVGSFGGLVQLQNLTKETVSVRQFGINDGLRDNVIYAVQSDALGHVWASSNRGLMRLARGAARWQSYDRQDGLSDDEFNLNASARLPDGRLAFGGISGVTLIDPALEPRFSVDTPMVVTAIQHSGQREQTLWSPPSSQLQLPAANSQLMLRFALPGTPNRHHQHFFYRFKGSEKWIDLHTKRELYFASLPVGQHALELAWSFGEQPIASALQMQVDIVPLWWQRRDVRWTAVFLLLSVTLFWLWSRHRHLQQRLQQEKALRASDERLRLALWGTGDALWEWQVDSGHVTRTGIDNLLSIDNADVENTMQWRNKITHSDDVAAANNQLQLHLDGVLPFYEAQYRLRNGHGDWIWVLDRGQVVERDADGKPMRMAGTMRDISEKQHRENELQVLANYDTLTHLPNRTLFHDRLKHSLLSAERYGRRVVLVFIDLDRFKSVNDSFGHQVGDQLLIAVAERLRACVRADETVARLGGDEFTVILKNISNLPSINRVLESVQQAFATPFQMSEHTVHISPSIGVSIFPDDADNAEKLLNRADLAMYAAKEQGRNTLRYFELSMNKTAQRRAEMSLALRKAEDADELLLHFQPRMTVKQKQITGFEALLRWNSAALGSVSPVEFIPIAEESGLIGSLGYWVLDAVINQLQKWQSSELRGLPIAVNVSIRQLFDPKFQFHIAAMLDKYQVSPSLLHIEITETVLMDNVDQAIATLQQLREMGIAICIDDFGTGYSSLGYLCRLPIDGLKVDKSFVSNMIGHDDDAVIVDTIIAMAHALRLYVIAEGVETQEQLQFLTDKGCEEIQGFWLARPMPALACEKFMHQYLAGQSSP